jgi:hypothetical protein
VARSNVQGTLYIAHLDPKVSHAQHYIGWTEGPVEKRWETHLRKAGSPLIRAAVERGATITFADLGPGTRWDERRMHNAKRGARFCPTCRIDRAYAKSATGPIKSRAA